jgi:hypothetical protein
VVNLLFKLADSPSDAEWGATATELRASSARFRQKTLVLNRFICHLDPETQRIVPHLVTKVACYGLLVIYIIKGAVFGSQPPRRLLIVSRQQSLHPVYDVCPTRRLPNNGRCGKFVVDSIPCCIEEEWDAPRLK